MVLFLSGALQKLVCHSSVLQVKGSNTYLWHRVLFTLSNGRFLVFHSIFVLILLSVRGRWCGIAEVVEEQENKRDNVRVPDPKLGVLKCDPSLPLTIPSRVQLLPTEG